VLVITSATQPTLFLGNCRTVPRAGPGGLLKTAGKARFSS